MGSSSSKKRVFIGVAIALFLVAGMGVVFAVDTWNDVNRVSIDRPSTAEPGGPVAQEPEGSENELPPATDLLDGSEVILLVGSDSREELDDNEGFGDFEGRRADVVMVLIRAGDRTAILSLPRDLWVHDACTGGENRLNALLEGCGQVMNGPTLLTVGVEELIGEEVDHYAMVNFEGFQEAVDELGGYEICVENPVRDSLAKLALPAGCTHASGEQTLAWLRSRRTEELTENGWRTIPGMNDLVRNERQRGFLIDMLSMLSDLSSPQALTSLASSLAPHVTVDDRLTLSDAVSLAWAMRSLGLGSTTELSVPVADHVAENGAAVLTPTTPVDEIVSAFIDEGTTAGDSVEMAVRPVPTP